jgi:hypothetical protein
VEIEGERAYMHRRLINPRRPESTEQILGCAQRKTNAKNTTKL